MKRFSPPADIAQSSSDEPHPAAQMANAMENVPSDSLGKNFLVLVLVWKTVLNLIKEMLQPLTEQLDQLKESVAQITAMADGQNYRAPPHLIQKYTGKEEGRGKQQRVACDS